MVKDDLLAAIKTTLGKTKVMHLAAIAAQEHDSVQVVVDLTFDEEEKIAFRAAWILENIYTQHNAKFIPCLTYFLNRFAEQNNYSCRRHFAKILAFITHKNAPESIKNAIGHYDTAALVETVFSWLIDENVPVAIKSHCLTILANLSVKHHWIKEELLATIDYLIDKESIAFFAKVKQIKKQLKQTATKKP